MKNMPEKPLNPFSWDLINEYKDDGFKLVVVYGAPRIGKTGFSCKVMGDCWDYLKGYPLSIDLLKKCMGWRPDKVIEQWLKIDKKIPGFIWDDAGMWLYAMDWSHPVLKAMMKYFNVVGSDMASLILTTPDPRWVLHKLVSMPGAHTVKIIRSGSVLQDNPWNRNVREAFGYNQYWLPDLKKMRVGHWHGFRFSKLLPDDVYNWYNPERKIYADEAKMLIKETILKHGAKDGMKGPRLPEGMAEAMDNALSLTDELIEKGEYLEDLKDV